jgi:hypothetical protein
MPRRIRDFALMSAGGTPGPGTAPDGYTDKVVKYVPADVVAAWTAAVAVIKGAVGIPSGTVLWICFAVGLVLAFLWTLKQTHEPGQPPAHKQAFVALVAFAVWVLALGDLDTALSVIKGWNPAYAKLILIGFTAVSGLI